MNAREIFRKLKRRCGDIFLGVFACDRLPARLPPRRPLMLICNTDPHNKPGEHWIAIYVDSRGEYFDSYGMETPLIFKTFLNRYCSSWIRNNVQLQSVISSFCGHYCVFYCLLKSLKYDMKSILVCFTADTMLNDTIVNRYVCHYLK